MRLKTTLAMFMCCAASMLALSQARAAAITNMDEIPYDLTISIGGAEQQVAIEPGKTWRTQAGDVAVRYKKRWMRLDDGDEYAIWKNSKGGADIVKQRRGSLDARSK